MIPLTENKKKPYDKQKFCYICEKISYGDKIPVNTKTNSCGVS